MDTTMSSHNASHMSSTAPPTGGLEGVEAEVEALRRAIEAEQAEIAAISDGMQELYQRNACEEMLCRLERRIQVIENKGVDCVHWRIEDIEQKRSKCKQGEHIASPEFSAGGLDGFRFHFYPRGDDFAEEGYCSLYLLIPIDTKISRTLFLGRTRHGPVESEATKNCGVSEMCVLSNEIDKATGSIVIGVDDLKILQAPFMAETRKKLQLVT